MSCGKGLSPGSLGREAVVRSRASTGREFDEAEMIETNTFRLTLYCRKRRYRLFISVSGGENAAE